MKDAIECGVKSLGPTEAKPEQFEAIKCALNGEDVFVSVPTGYGKSLIVHFCVLVI